MWEPSKFLKFPGFPSNRNDVLNVYTEGKFLLRLHRDPIEDAKAVADEAFERLGDRMSAAGRPRSAVGMDFLVWAAMAHRVAPAELKAFLDACHAVKHLMESD